ncbi:MAG: hypothetical protein ABSG21_03490 [Spirochaetia bacterium]|jgi:hypothetical protein
MSTRKRGGIVPLLLALAVAHTHAQAQGSDTDPKDALQELLSKALTVTVSARVLPPDAQEEAPIWNAESTKLTLPGRSIRVRLDGENVRIYLICTPYLKDDGEVLLLAQGQVWFTESAEKANRYFSTFYSIPVSFGEKVLFFPLGLSDADEQQKNHFNIEVEIKIVPYEKKQ